MRGPLDSASRLPNSSECLWNQRSKFSCPSSARLLEAQGSGQIKLNAQLLLLVGWVGIAGLDCMMSAPRRSGSSGGPARAHRPTPRFLGAKV
jgi:hypothetical protein